MPDRPPDPKLSQKKVNRISRLFKRTPRNSVPSSPVIISATEGKSSRISSTLDLTNTRNDSNGGVTLNDGPQASNAAPPSTTSHPQAVSDSASAQPAVSTSTKAQVDSSTTQAPNDTRTQAKQG